MFYKSTFNGDISKWNVSNGTQFSWMFVDSVFNNDISTWNVRNGKHFQRMFYYGVRRLAHVRPPYLQPFYCT
jgi:hypothetical protein